MKITRKLFFLCSAGMIITLPSVSPAQESDSNDSSAGQTSAPTEPDSPSTPTSDPAIEHPSPPTTDEESSGEAVWSSKSLLTIMLALLGIAFVYFMRRAGRKMDS